MSLEIPTGCEGCIQKQLAQAELQLELGGTAKLCPLLSLGTLGLRATEYLKGYKQPIDQCAAGKENAISQQVRGEEGIVAIELAREVLGLTLHQEQLAA